MANRILAIVACSVLAGSAQAALIDHGTYIADNVSGLDWLKLTETDGRSYNDVFSELGSGGNLDGWTYASYNQAAGLLLQFGLRPGTYTYGKPTAAQIDAINLSISFLGDTFEIGPTYRGFQGVPSNPTVQGAHMLLYATYNSAGNFHVINTVSGFSSQIDSQPSSYTGHFLIRAAVVPIPSALWMFSAALVGLIPLRLRRPAEAQAP